MAWTCSGRVTPLLAESWTVDPDGRVYTFKLRKGVKFHDGEAFDASDVKWSFERAKAATSTNKLKKAVFDNISRIDTPDPHTVILVLNQADGNFLFRMGENPTVVLDPKSGDVVDVTRRADDPGDTDQAQPGVEVEQQVAEEPRRQQVQLDREAVQDHRRQAQRQILKPVDPVPALLGHRAE